MLVREVQTASRQYCHRQMTWARGLPLFQWISASQSPDAVLNQITSSLTAPEDAGDFKDPQLGRLSDEEARQMKRYISELRIFDNPDEVHAVVQWAHTAVHRT